MFGELIEHTGTLYSEEYKQNFIANRVSAQVLAEPNKKYKFTLYINGQNISLWFKEQTGKLRQTLRQSIESPRKSKGFKL